MRARVDMKLMFERAGFRLARSNGHLTWDCPCGHTRLTTPATPGKGRSCDNTEALMKRTLRVCSQQQRRGAA